MNFKKIFIRFAIIPILNTGCGVKGDPVPPPGSEIPPWPQEYLETNPKSPLQIMATPNIEDEDQTQ